MNRTAKPVFTFKDYPFNWPEFYQFRKKVINEIQNKNTIGIYSFDLHGLPVWPCIRVPSDTRIDQRGSPSAGSVCLAGVLGALMISPAFAQVQIAEPFTVDFSVTVISMASNDDQFEAMGCELNKETNIVEC